MHSLSNLAFKTFLRITTAFPWELWTYKYEKQWLQIKPPNKKSNKVNTCVNNNDIWSPKRHYTANRNTKLYLRKLFSHIGTNTEFHYQACDLGKGNHTSKQNISAFLYNDSTTGHSKEASCKCWHNWLLPPNCRMASQNFYFRNMELYAAMEWQNGFKFNFIRKPFTLIGSSAPKSSFDFIS